MIYYFDTRIPLDKILPRNLFAKGFKPDLLPSKSQIRALREKKLSNLTYYKVASWVLTPLTDTMPNGQSKLQGGLDEQKKAKLLAKRTEKD